jgi:predicted Rossmann fold nucleotide-binding protein DprA/Smf involved in DNA uptake
MGRNKIVYACSRATLVVATDEGTGGTWTGAVEALAHGFATVAVWTGKGAPDGNHVLARRGAVAIEDVSQALEFPGEHAAVQPSTQATLF